MNYRHQFHAGNFADVVKHALLVALVRALQRKDKGCLLLDTHAGRGRYDLAAAAAGDSLARRPEWPDGLGRLAEDAAGGELLADYLGLVREFDRGQGNLAVEPRFYPGSPGLLRALLRPVDRLVLVERHPAECAALRAFAAGWPRTEVREGDGYALLRALLPPPERRGLILLDPPFEAPEEFAWLAAAVGEGLRRFPTGVFAAWYPLTQRARVDEFLHAVSTLGPPPCLTAELTVAGEAFGLKLRGCGLLVLNPPWGFAPVAQSLLDLLVPRLAQAPGGEGRLTWLVPDR
jgi:23S rRNA (adenine2030-N6)-methyltransferase